MTGTKTTGNKTTGNKTIPSSLRTEKPSWLFGTGASAIERLLVYFAAVVGVSVFVLHARLGPTALSIAAENVAPLREQLARAGISLAYSPS